MALIAKKTTALTAEDVADLTAGTAARCPSPVPARWWDLWERDLALLRYEDVAGDAAATWHVLPTDKARGILARMGVEVPR